IILCMIFYFAIGILFLLLVIFVYLYKRAKTEKNDLILQLEHVSSRKQSLSTKYGKMTEQFMPFLEKYPYDYHNFRFIGTPIDGVQFEDDKIIFFEFKTASSKLSTKQRNIRNIIEKGNIEFKEFRISDKV
ncbi:Holliday junction resolvase-like protein, partial [Candidatus Aenigmatarchaeota archaeon]